VKLDEVLVTRVLGDFAMLIKSAAESTEKGRFTTIVALAKQAQHFQQLSSSRIGDFDAIDYEGGIIQNAQVGYINGAPLGGGFGDQAEMMRTLIDSLKDINARRQSPAVELNELLSVRRTLKDDGEPTEDIDTRIKTLRKEIANGNTSTVVRSQLLRGSETGTLGSGDDPLVGERDADGAEGAAVVVRTCGQQAVDERGGARPDEGFLAAQE